MTLITSDQEKFLKFLSKGSNKIERDRALAIIAEMRDDAGWINFEDIATRSPQTLMGSAGHQLRRSHKVSCLGKCYPSSTTTGTNRTSSNVPSDSYPRNARHDQMREL